jgi:hypothetical protein
LEQLLGMSVVGALLLPDGSNDCELSPQLQLDGLKTAVLSYRYQSICCCVSSNALHGVSKDTLPHAAAAACAFTTHIIPYNSPHVVLVKQQRPNTLQPSHGDGMSSTTPSNITHCRCLHSCRLPKLARSLSTSAHATNLTSIIIRGWQLDPHFGQHLATFLQHLQDVSTLRHLVLTLPCTPPAAAAPLGKVTQLQSLRMCIDVCHSSELMLRQDTGVLQAPTLLGCGRLLQPFQPSSKHAHSTLTLAASFAGSSGPVVTLPVGDECYSRAFSVVEGLASPGGSSALDGVPEAAAHTVL